MFAEKKEETMNEGLSLTPSVSVLETEKDTILFDGRQDRYFQLNGLGLIAVESLGETMGVDTIARRVVEAYDIDAKTADVDVRAFLV